jgi:methylenetetrahydrofolate dehydrogenase (NADP+)/methenyltetrahydrofolate cyclohydrolase
MPKTTSETELLKKIKELNEDDDIDGFIVQLPLPKQIDDAKNFNGYRSDKDVDGFHPKILEKWLWI